MSRTTFRVTDKAAADLEQIWRHIAEDDPRAADRFIDQILARFPMLAAQPRMGAARPDLRAGIRYLPYKNYLIFYRLEAEEIAIVHVLYGGRDLLGEDFEAE